MNEKSLIAINGQGINLSEKYELMAYGAGGHSENCIGVVFP